MKEDPGCRDERRRQSMRDRHHNGIDYVDVFGDPNDANAPKRHLCVHFLTDIPPEFLPAQEGKSLSAEERDRALRHVVIRGGRRIADLRAVDVDPHATDDAYEQDCLRIDVDREGDWSTYTLCFVELNEQGQPTSEPLRSLDPRYACIDFSFKLDCPAEIDCKTDEVCPPPERVRPAISYLARDYATFRRLLLDRLALLMPDWKERHVPDIGITLVELLAYTADSLSYYQDAVATEAYLDTARLRISVRRHARLVDYVMHEGCNARVFVTLEAAKDGKLTPRDLYFVTRLSANAEETVLREEDLEKAPPGFLVFEPLTQAAEIEVRKAHNSIAIYTWGDAECCIPKGARRATLVDGWVETPAPKESDAPPAIAAPDAYERRRPRRRSPKQEATPEECPPPQPPPHERPRKLHLRPGDFLLFEELACAGTAFRSEKEGDGGFDGTTPMPDADRTHRHVVRLTRVTPAVDPLNDQPVLEVEWCAEDAMPFMLCVSAVGTAPQCDFIEGLAVARGNIVLADHGASVTEALDPIEERETGDVCEGEDDLAEMARLPKPYRPELTNAPLTFAQPLDDRACATTLLHQRPRAALPSIAVTSDAPRIHGREPHETWTARYDLLRSGPDDADFVAEVDDEGCAHLRFGDGTHGRAIETGMTLTASYRFGNGRAGLTGAESIRHIVFRKAFNDVILGVRNPLPSAGAADPEPVAEVKMFAPSAFRKDLQRAITGDDYATLAQFLRHPERDPAVQSAAGALVWTGSWYEADVAVDPFGTPALAAPLRDSIEARLQRYRRMGHDLRVGAAAVVPLRLELDVCIEPHYLRAHVLAAVREALSNRLLPDGRRGFFHPDNLSFGEAVYVSRIVAAVMAVEGVADVEVTRLERLAQATLVPAPDSGVLPLRPNEVARLDNDPASPENGILTFANVRGGR